MKISSKFIIKINNHTIYNYFVCNQGNKSQMIFFFYQIFSILLYQLASPSAMRVTSQRILSFFSLLSPCRIFMPCSGRSSTRYTPLAGLSWLSSAILSSNLILLALECWTWLTGIGHNLLFLTVTARKRSLFCITMTICAIYTGTI